MRRVPCAGIPRARAAPIVGYLPTALLGLVAGLALLGCAATAEEPLVESGDEEVVAVAAPKTRRSLQGFKCPPAGSQVKVAFFDADSTLRVSKMNAVTARSVDDVDILPFAATEIRALRKSGHLIAIISNQGGVSSGRTTFEVAEGALAFTASQLTSLGARIDYFDFAEAPDNHRKPETGMAEELGRVLDETCHAKLDVAHSRMTGDSGYQQGVDGPHPDGRPADDFSNADRLFAENLGVPFAEPTDAFGWRKLGVFNVLGENELVGFLARIDEEAARARAAGDETRARELEREAARNRKVNRLSAPGG